MRLRRIDAPEAEQTCQREAKRHLVQLVLDKDVRCMRHDEDQNGQLLAHCWAGDVEINRWPVEQGGGTVSFGGYQRVERQARVSKLGIWVREHCRLSDWRADNRVF